MYCYYCPFWLPDNLHSVNGTCTRNNFPSRADAEYNCYINCEEDELTDETL